MKPRVEFIYDPIRKGTLIIVWKGMRIVYRENVEDGINKEEQAKITKKLKRKFKDA